MALTGREMRLCWPQKVAVCTVGRPVLQRVLGDLVKKFGIALVVTVGDCRADTVFHTLAGYMEAFCDSRVEAFVDI